MYSEERNESSDHLGILHLFGKNLRLCCLPVTVNGVVVAYTYRYLLAVIGKM